MTSQIHAKELAGAALMLLVGIIAIGLIVIAEGAAFVRGRLGIRGVARGTHTP